jgi:hypothetical protein
MHCFHDSPCLRFQRQHFHKLYAAYEAIVVRRYEYPTLTEHDRQCNIFICSSATWTGTSSDVRSCRPSKYRWALVSTGATGHPLAAYRDIVAISMKVMSLL